MAAFNFKNFSLQHEKSTLKIGSDSVLLSSLVTISEYKNILDIGCGCGVISFILASRLYETKCFNGSIVGVDIDRESIEEANLNCKYFPYSQKNTINFYNKKVQNINKGDFPPFDLIVTNPPFFYNDLKPTSEKKIISKHADKNLTFDEIIDKILLLMDPNGSFYIILPSQEFNIFLQKATDKLFPYTLTYIHSNYKKSANRIVAGFLLNKSTNCIKKTLYIRDMFNNYTIEYRNLVKNILTANF